MSIWARQLDIGVADNPKVKILTGPSLFTGASCNTDPIQGEADGYFIQNVISVRIKEETDRYLNSNFIDTVKLKIEYGEDASHLQTINSMDFIVSYNKDPRAKYNSRKYFHFTGAKYVKITVLNLPAPLINGVNAQDLLIVENEIRVIRYNTLKNTTATGFNQSIQDNELTVNWTWPVEAGYTHTQLEWAWVEDDVIDYYKVNDTLDNNLLFTNNATRIDLPYGIMTYDIPLLYGDSGHLYWRVRAVSLHKSGSRSDGAWCTTQNYAYTGHEGGLNWQVTTSFAEEGKRKSVIQYFDGSLRARQTVTKDNVTNTVVIGETMYDKEGRPAVQILPFPATTSSIAYTGSPNLFQRNSSLGLSADQTNSDNPADFFDLEPIATSTSITPALLTSNGAARYYSSSNPAKTDDLQKNIPDAEGYPYSITRYTPDGTDRIMAQTDAGAAMQMGKKHETRYYYSTVAQEELDALFGTEAGNNAHYFKNMVRDENGQMTVSYVDMHGRTVATALAGEAPANLTKLDLNATHYPGQSATYVTRNLLNSNINTVKNNSVEAINSLAVPARGLYTFHYSLNPDSLSLPTCPGTSPASVCYDCMYDLEFSITDESGDTLPIIRKYSNVSLSVDNDCSTPAIKFLDSGNINAPRSNSIDFSLMLDPGSYSVRKTLTISESSLQKFRDEYIAAAKLCTSLEFLTDSIATVLKTVTNCEEPVQPLTCEACLSEIGNDFNGFKGIYLAAGNTASDNEIWAAFNIAKQNCNRLCTTTSQALTSKRQMMLSDLIPFSGQYAKDPSQLALPGSAYGNYDIFSTQNSGQPFYKAPWSATYQLTPYLNSLNQPDPVNQVLSDMSPADFSQTFNYKWAEALLPHHPEYKKLVFAESNLKASYDSINAFNQVSTFSEAVSRNYVLFNGNTIATPYNDPFFLLTTGSGQQAMIDMVATNYKTQNGITLSMWRIAYGEAKCKYIADLSTRKTCYDNAPLQPSNISGSAFDNLTTEEKDRAWIMFRTLYSAERDRLVNQYIQSHVSDPIDAQDIVDEGYILHFPTEAQQVQQSNTTGDWAWWPTTAGGEPNVPSGQQAALIVQQYNDRCEGYVPNWRAALLQCDTLNKRADKEEIINLITSQMIQVCKKGSDAANPYGSSSVAPGTPQDGSPRSFEEIITNVLAIKGIDKDELCNPFVIEFPKPYGRTPIFTPEVISAIDTCTCKRFTALKQEIANAGHNPNIRDTLNKYLWLAYKDTVSQVLFSALDNCSQLGTQQVVCYTAYNTIIHPCDEENPCGGGGEAFRAGQQLKTAKFKKDSSSSKVVLRVPDCGPGYHWDVTLLECVSDDIPLPCPVGQHWDYEQMTCVDDAPQVCEPGYHWDPILQDCVPNAECQTACPFLKCDTIKSYSLALPIPQPLPAFLKCGYQSPKCFTCSELSSLVGSFKAYFGSPLNSVPPFGTNNLSADQLKYNVLFQRFVNYKTGFTYSWADYAKAAADANCNLANYQSNTDSTQTVICTNSKPVNDTTGIILYNPPCQKIYNMASAMAQQIYESRINAKLADFEAQYRARCLGAKDREVFNVSDTLKEYHFTLYYYDQAGNLIKTVSPKGARPDFSKAFTDTVAARRLRNVIDTLPHIMATHYRYNSLNRIMMQYSPDGGVTRFWYDKLGRLAVSQNAQQFIDHKYSYNLYDNLGRITEVGQKPQTDAMTQAISQDSAALDSWINNSGGTKEQITFTVYDVPYTPLGGTYFTQQNLRNRISYTATKKRATDNGHYTATFYTYDVHGNVDTLLQDYCGIPELTQPEERFKRIIYQHDLISGKVNMVSYQPGKSDAFYHRYTYDAENRLTKVHTSRDSVYWERDAAYTFYKHGALARMELGDQQVQGMDYAYTVQGWLKGINTTNIGNAGFDIGRDGAAGNNLLVGKDILGFALHYYDAVEGNDTWLDYKPIYNASAFARPGTAAGFVSLFNGSISAISINNTGLKKGDQLATNALPLFYKYSYDQLSRIVSQQAFKGLNDVSNQWVPVALNDYKETVSYDPNGNILTYNRKGSPSTGKPTDMDALRYNYSVGTNRLNYVYDSVSAGNYAADVDAQSTGNYTYDAIGNLKSDASEHINNITWTAYGKVDTVSKDTVTITYSYDAAGNRITKTVNGKTTIYVRDASGNVMSIYEKPAATPLKQIETHLFGSSRLGLTRSLTTAPDSVDLQGGFGRAALSTFTRGEKIFELTNHLGNVLATVSDKKRPHSSDGSTRDYYEAEIITATDYYPFGMQMPGRGISDSAGTGTNCHDEWQNATELAASSNLDNGAVTNGAEINHNGVRWTASGTNTIALYSQAIKVTNTGSSSDGVVAYIPASSVEPNTTYVMEFDVTDKSSTIAYFNCQAHTPDDGPYRVSTRKTGLGHHTMIFTTPSNLPAYIRLRITSNQVGAGTWFVVDNFVTRKYKIVNESLVLRTDFNTGVMAGLSVSADGMLWSPLNSSITSLSLSGTADKKLQVTCTTADEGYLKTEFALTGNHEYLMRFSLAQDSLDKRLGLRLYARIGGVWAQTTSSGISYSGAGNYLYNFPHPAGADSARIEFIRSNAGNTYDGYRTPYSIDNFSIAQLDTVSGQSVTVCESCHQEMSDGTELKASSNLDNGVTQNGTDFIHNNVIWRRQASVITSYSNGAIKVTNSGGGSEGILALPPFPTVEPNTTYIMECDILEQSPGITNLVFYAIDNTGGQYRVASSQPGVGHHSIVFTTPATLGTYLTFRVSASPATAGLYFVVDNFVFKKYRAVRQTQHYGTDFNTAVMNGVNIYDNGQVWRPFNSTLSNLSLTSGADKKIQVNCISTNASTSRVITDMPAVAGQKYLVKFSMAQGQQDKRFFWNLYSRTGSGSFTAFQQGIFATGSGDYQFNFTMPSGTDQFRLEFLRQNTGSSLDGLDVPYTIDNVSLTRLDPVDSLPVTVCEGGGSANGSGNSAYRYGFNGQEKSDEIKGEGQSYTSDFWEYDPRLGRRWNLDPVIHEAISGYACFSNDPINNVDPDGNSDSSAIKHSLSSDQLLAGVNIAFDEIQKSLKNKTGLANDNVVMNLQNAIDEYANSHNIKTVREYREFRENVFQYHYGFQVMALWTDGMSALTHLGTTLHNSKYASNFKVQAAMLHIRPFEKKAALFKGLLWEATTMMASSARMALGNMTGSNGPRAPSRLLLKYSYLNEALKVQKKAIVEVMKMSKTQRGNISTMVTGVNIRTGQIATGKKLRYTGDSYCAEDMVVAQLGGNKREILFTSAFRPRTEVKVPVCLRCQTKYQPWQFTPGTTFEQP